MRQSTPETISDDAIDSIQTVGSAIGQIFHENDDIGVLIRLQNASTRTEFLQAFEKAAMQAQKKSLDDAPRPWEASQDEDVGAVLQLIADEETFEPAKRMFVIHAALAAQYQNIQSSESAGGGDDE